MSGYNSKEVGLRIMELRKEKNMTLSEIGMAIGESKQTVFKYERGIIENIPYKTIEKIAKYHDVSPTYIVGWNETPKIKIITGGDQMKRLCECKQEKLVEILKEFNDMVYSDVKTVTTCDTEGNAIPETSRPATDKDKLDFLYDSWAAASQKIFDLGVDLDEPTEVTL